LNTVLWQEIAKISARSCQIDPFWQKLAKKIEHYVKWNCCF